MSLLGPIGLSPEDAEAYEAEFQRRLEEEAAKISRLNKAAPEPEPHYLLDYLLRAGPLPYKPARRMRYLRRTFHTSWKTI